MDIFNDDEPLVFEIQDASHGSAPCERADYASCAPQGIPVQDIDVSTRRRALNEETVVRLMASMSLPQIGLRTPITVYRESKTERFILVTGRHRLEAARRLGWETIDAVLVRGTPEERRMWEIAENLHRAELTVLERDEQIAEWIQLVEKVSPSNKPSQVATVSKGGRGKESGARRAARRLGVDKDDAHRAMKVATLSEEAKDIARETGLDDNRTALLGAAKAEDSVTFLQKEAARRRAKREAEEDAIPAPAQEFADWVSEKAEPEEIPMLIVWMEKARPKDVVRALREKQGSTPKKSASASGRAGRKGHPVEPTSVAPEDDGSERRFPRFP